MKGLEKSGDSEGVYNPYSEIKYGFYRALVAYVLGERDAQTEFSVRDLVLTIRKGDTDALFAQLRSLFFNIDKLLKLRYITKVKMIFTLEL